MTKLETIEFNNKQVFLEAVNEVLAGNEIFRTYTTKSGEKKKVKIISNHRLYVGNNYSMNINEGANGKVYVSIDYFGAEDRIRIAKTQKDSSEKEL